ncbi:MAG: hypothetical protein KUL77_02720 [Thermomonas sp.]|uniref:lysozyme inhibitor LprI family protein n=1 Tax=Thermomonas sp. TaxID=1971895 RepID=UPI001EC8D1E3|nr:lysozyme inhibitor LprI family protein [Thermomonas sp.]MBV2208460.1 hypothetical protein [Thermomonas sp.]
MDAYLALLETVEAESWRQEDAAEGLSNTTVTRAGIRETQRAWLKYRDAWLTFADARYWDKQAIVTWLTRQRTDQLVGFQPE